MRDQSQLQHRDDPALHAARRARLADIVGSDGVAMIAATPERNRNNDVDYPYRPNSDFRYLTGFLEPEAIAVIAPGFDAGDYLLFCRARNAEQEVWIGRRAGPEGAMADYGADRAFAIDEFEDWIDRLLDGRRKLYLTLGTHPEFEQSVLDHMSALRSQGRGGVPPCELAVLEPVLHEMRLRKSAAEVALMRQAAATSARAHSAAMQAVRPGMHEYQLAAVLHYTFESDGMQWAYPTIVGAGENACVLHYIENSAPMADGDLVLIDAGAEHRGYAGDITRTFPVNGRFSEAQRTLYDIVLAANRAAIEAARPGEPMNAVHQAALHVLVAGLIEVGLLEGSVDDAIAEESYSAYFMHGTSHWLGMDVHDVGDYKIDGEWRALEPGMALTVEPGLYVRADDNPTSRFANIGIRIEDDIVITETGCDVLTADVPKDADEIEALMAKPYRSETP
ncbi:proline aminopeptidase P II [Salinisphaera sp. S4-8]|uniref:Xaa-Pro aminopeptidase n=1 Tax=Salinisphaera sp. S4-8 TaxID=633357 RepID=UPI003340527A